MEWRKIPGFSKYLVSEKGDVMRIYKGGTSIVLHGNNNGRYIRYTLINDDGEKRGVTCQRIVALAFIDNSKGYGIVKHKDGDTKNNDVRNLYWSGNEPFKRYIKKIQRLRYERNKAEVVSE